MKSSQPLHIPEDFKLDSQFAFQSITCHKAFLYSSVQSGTTTTEAEGRQEYFAPRIRTHRRTSTRLGKTLKSLSTLGGRIPAPLNPTTEHCSTLKEEGEEGGGGNLGSDYLPERLRTKLQVTQIT